MNKVVKLPFSNLNFDPYLFFGFLILISFSIVMVGSASIAIVERFKVSEFYFIINHCKYLLISLLGGFLTTLLPIKYLQKMSYYAAILGFILLSLVFLPSISKTVNGSCRWIFLGSISIQPSELVKLLLNIYIAGYLVRRKDSVRSKFTGFLIPLIILLGIDILLLLEPDFGAMFIVTCTVFSLLFIAGVRIRYLLCLALLGSIVIVGLLISSTYRMQRIIGFLNPWEDQFNKGYQLVQSLIAFGRGGWLGLGLGNSVQKLLYLPEAYTDFIFAIIAEELGLIGVLIIIFLLSVVIIRCFFIARIAVLAKKHFAGYVAYGIAFWLGLQSIVNIGVNIGLLPTKGLTLPFVSYGGNSLLVCCVAIGIIFRIDFELRKEINLLKK